MSTIIDVLDKRKIFVILCIHSADIRTNMIDELTN